MYNKVKNHTLTSPERIKNLIRLGEYCNQSNIEGDFVECGTYKGGTAAVLSSCMGSGRHLWLYDSFQGMPETSDIDGLDASDCVGVCAATVADVKEAMQLVSTREDKYSIYEGWFEDTFKPENLPEKVALLHCDADWYNSVLLVLNTFYDRIPDGGCIILDDFGYWEGCREAFYDFCAAKGIKPLLERVGSSQAYWIKGKEANRQKSWRGASPLTGGSDVKLLQSFDVKAVCNKWQKDFGFNVAAEFGEHKSFELYECLTTGLRFFYPYDLYGSDKLYEKLLMVEGLYIHDVWAFDIAKEEMLRNECKTAFEIGSATGYFVKTMLDSGVDIQGIDLNEVAVGIAKKNNLPVRNMQLQDAAEKYGPVFDAVCTFEVLEHVPNPKEFIAWGLQLLKPGGLMIITVPNRNSFIKHQRPLLDMPPHHMTQWGAETFKALEAIFPVKLEEVKTEPLATYHAEFFLHAYSEHFRKTRPYGRLVFNNVTEAIYRQLMKIDVLRRLLVGQTLYVSLRKS